jgi:ATP-dependent protease ClpP protease subunit
MIASLTKPTVSLVIGDSHSIGVPLAVAADYSFIVPSATVIIHPVRMNGTVLGTPQTYSQFQQIQDRILNFIAGHSRIETKKLEELMMNTSMLSRDLGTVLVGKEAVSNGLLQELGGIGRALVKLKQMIAQESQPDR